MPSRPRDRFLPALAVLFLLAVLVEVFYPRSHSAAPAFPSTEISAQKDSIPDTTITIAKSPAPEWLFVLIKDSMKDHGPVWVDSVRLIEVYHLPERKKVQTLNAGPNAWLTEGDTEIVQRLQTEDMNFDGHDDLRLLNWFGTRGQEQFNYWLFDTVTKKFRPDTNLAVLYDPQFDHDKKVIYSTLRYGCCWEHESKMLQWKNGQLELLREEDVENDMSDTTGDAVFVTLKDRENGELKTKQFRLAHITKEYLDFDPGW